MIQPLIFQNSPILHEPCQTVTVFGDELKSLIVDMEDTMVANGGVGLAANQIGVDAAVFVYDCETQGKGHIVNPDLRVLTHRTMTEQEGCLSVPGLQYLSGTHYLIGTEIVTTFTLSDSFDLAHLDELSKDVSAIRETVQRMVSHGDLIESDGMGKLRWRLSPEPSHRGHPVRYRKVVCTGVNSDNQPVTVEGTGLLGRCLQHETDHLDGKLFMDRIGK